MENIITGRAFVLGDNIDTDQIIPAEHLVYSMDDENEAKLYGRFALSSVPVDQSGAAGERPGGGGQDLCAAGILGLCHDLCDRPGAGHARHAENRRAEDRDEFSLKLSDVLAVPLRGLCQGGSPAAA